MTDQLSCKDDPIRWATYGERFHHRYICMKCGKDHTAFSLKKRLLLGSSFVGCFGLFMAGCILFVKVGWCVILNDSNCWSHFP